MRVVILSSSSWLPGVLEQKQPLQPRKRLSPANAPPGMRYCVRPSMSTRGRRVTSGAADCSVLELVLSSEEAIERQGWVGGREEGCIGGAACQ